MFFYGYRIQILFLCFAEEHERSLKAAKEAVLLFSNLSAECNTLQLQLFLHQRGTQSSEKRDSATSKIKHVLDILAVRMKAADIAAKAVLAGKTTLSKRAMKAANEATYVSGDDARLVVERECF